MTFSDKQATTNGAFINRFAVGFFIPNALYGIVPVIRGLLLGVLLRLPVALIANANSADLLFEGKAPQLGAAEVTRNLHCH